MSFRVACHCLCFLGSCFIYFTILAKLIRPLFLLFFFLSFLIILLYGLSVIFYELGMKFVIFHFRLIAALSRDLLEDFLPLVPSPLDRNILFHCLYFCDLSLLFSLWGSVSSNGIFFMSFFYFSFLFFLCQFFFFVFVPFSKICRK